MAVVNMKIAPSDFWAMTFSEFVHILEWTRPKQEGDYAGSLNKGDVDELREWMDSW